MATQTKNFQARAANNIARNRTDESDEISLMKAQLAEMQRRLDTASKLDAENAALKAENAALKKGAEIAAEVPVKKGAEVPVKTPSKNRETRQPIGVWANRQNAGKQAAVVEAEKQESGKQEAAIDNGKEEKTFENKEQDDVEQAPEVAASAAVSAIGSDMISPEEANQFQEPKTKRQQKKEQKNDPVEHLKKKLYQAKFVNNSHKIEEAEKTKSERTALIAQYKALSEIKPKALAPYVEIAMHERKAPGWKTTDAKITVIRAEDEMIPADKEEADIIKNDRPMAYDEMSDQMQMDYDKTREKFAKSVVSKVISNIAHFRTFEETIDFLKRALTATNHSGGDLNVWAYKLDRNDSGVVKTEFQHKFLARDIMNDKETDSLIHSKMMELVPGTFIKVNKVTDKETQEFYGWKCVVHRYLSPEERSKYKASKDVKA